MKLNWEILLPIKPASIKAIYLNLRDVFESHRKPLLVGMLFGVGATTLEVLGPILMGKAVDAALEKNRQVLAQLAFVYLVIIVLKAVLEGYQAWNLQRAGHKILNDLRTKLFEKFHALPIPYFDKNTSGRLLSRLMNDIKSLSELFSASMTMLVLDVFIITGTIIAMVVINWKLAVIVLFPFPFVMVLISYFGKKITESYGEVRVRLAEMNGFIAETNSGLSVIQRFSAVELRELRFEKIVSAHFKAQMGVLKIFALVQPYSNILNGLSFASLLGIGGWWVLQGKETLGGVVMFLGYLRNIYQPIRDLVEKYNTFLSAQVSAERISQIFDEPSETKEDRSTIHFLKDASLSFQNVSFKYDTQPNWAIQDCSFDLKAGRSLAIVGETGGGKTTITRLLLRFYEPQIGEIKVGGVNINELNRDYLRQQFGYVSQEVYILAGTARENLTFNVGNISDEQCLDFCERTLFWSVIEKRGGLDMVVLEGGSNLSVGERQLLSLTRILVQDPKIFILDEATANIDKMSEKALMKAISETLKGRTSITIAHRLSTVQACDEIIVLENGQMVERGGSQELLERKGRYFEYFCLQ